MCLIQPAGGQGSNLEQLTLIKIYSPVPARKTSLYPSQLLDKAKAAAGISLKTEDASLVLF